MPTTVNVTGQFGTLTTAQSVVCQLFRSVTDQSAEVAAAQCGYLIAVFFSGKNGGGSNLGTATVDAPAGVIAVAHAANLSDLLTKTFPPSSVLNQMALPLLNNAEAGTDTATVTTANSGGANADAFTGVTIGASAGLTYDSVHAAHGTLGFKYVIGATNQPTHLDWNTVGGVTELSGAVYIYMTANPASTIRGIEFRNAGAAVMILAAPSNGGLLQWKTGADASVGTLNNTALTLNQWNRLEFHVVFNGTTGSGEARWFAGDATSQTGTDSTFTATNSGAACDEIRIGMNSSSTTVSYTWWMDDFKVVAGSALPIGPAPYTSGPVQRQAWTPRRMPLGVQVPGPSQGPRFGTPAGSAMLNPNPKWPFWVTSKPPEAPAVATTPVSNTLDLPIEAAAAIAATASLPVEAQSNLAPTLVLPLEAQQAISATAAAVVEATGGVAATIVTPVESPGAVAASPALPLEALKNLAQTLTEPIESQQGLASSTGVPVEATGGVTATGVLPLEALAGIARALSLPLEAVQALASGVVVPVEALGGIVAAILSPLEATGGVAASTGLPLEATGGVASALSLPIEAPGVTVTPVSNTAVLFIEATGGVARATLVPFESASAVALALSLPFESYQPLAQTVVLPLEALTGGIAKTVTVPLEAPRGVAAAVVVPVEALARVAAQPGLPFEAPLSFIPTVPGTLVLVDRERGGAVVRDAVVSVAVVAAGRNGGLKVSDAETVSTALMSSPGLASSPSLVTADRGQPGSGTATVADAPAGRVTVLSR